MVNRPSSSFNAPSKTPLKRHIASSAVDPNRPQLQCRLASSLPRELVDNILRIAARTVGVSSSHKVSLLLLSKHYNQTLAPLIYHTVVVCSSASLHSFAQLVKSNSRIARYVKRLWIGPNDSTSDLIIAFSSPSHNESYYVSQLRDDSHACVRLILRSCRKLDDVALSGELLSLQVAHTYGTACQPTRLTSVNPHSFVGGFSAPIFRKVRLLKIIDINLAFEEADEIRTLADLEWLVWCAPKDYGDVTRDSNVLRRLLERPRRHLIHQDPIPMPSATPGNPHTPNPSTPATRTATPQLAANRTAADETRIVDALWTDFSSLELTEGLAPARLSKNDKFQRLTIQTASNRCQQFCTMLSDSYPLLQQSKTEQSGPHNHQGLSSGLAFVAHPVQEWDPLYHLPTIHPTSLSSIVLDEWDALRDLINQAAGAYSNLSMFDDGEQGAIVDAGNALNRQRQLWEQNIVTDFY